MVEGFICPSIKWLKDERFYENRSSYMHLMDGRVNPLKPMIFGQ